MKKEIKPWEMLSSRYLFREPWLTVRCCDMRLPNGNRVPKYYLLDYPDWVCTIAVTKDGKFVFVRQYRPGLAAVEYELCAGVCEAEDASPMVSAQRELLEETGYGRGRWTEFMCLSANPGTHTNRTHCFLAENVEIVDTQHLEPTEDISVHLLTEDEVRRLLASDAVQQALHAAPLWKYFATKNREK